VADFAADTDGNAVVSSTIALSLESEVTAFGSQRWDVRRLGKRRLNK
jgi:hypothetical protein